MGAEVQVTDVPHAGPAETFIGAAVVREGQADLLLRELLRLVTPAAETPRG